MLNRISGIWLFFSLCIEYANAQVYKRSLGVRLDESSFGISLVQRLAKPITAEIIGEFRQKDASVALIPRVHGKILGRRLNYFLGAGGHAGLLKNNSQRLQPFYGAGVMFGVEYKFNLLPIHISYDIRPLIQLKGHPDLFAFQSAFAIRIVGKSEKSRWKEKFQKWKEDKFGDDEAD
jgi:hypothetical protein